MSVEISVILLVFYVPLTRVEETTHLYLFSFISKCLQENKVMQNTLASSC